MRINSIINGNIRILLLNNTLSIQFTKIYENKCKGWTIVNRLGIAFCSFIPICYNHDFADTWNWIINLL